MRRVALPLSVIFALTAGLALAAGPSADAIFGALKQGFAGVKDYRADVSLTVKGPQVSINDMRMTVYFKKPNKIHVDAAQGMAMIPRGNFFGNPMTELASGARPVYLRSEKKLGVDCYVLKLVSPSGGPNATDMQIWIDTKRPVLVAMESQKDGGMRSAWRYEKIDGKYYLPVEIIADTSPPGGPNVGQPIKVTIKFSNYRVNKGISDKVFVQEATKPPPERPWRRHRH